jgi:hypothetical protein
MIVNSAFDVATEAVDARGHAVFAALCAQRTMIAWAGCDQAPGPLLREAVDQLFALLGEGPEADLDRLRSAHAQLEDELHPDCDFGDPHLPRMRAVVAVLGAADVALGDAEGAWEAAKAEIAVVKGLYLERTGSYDGVYDHPTFVRELGWQVADLADLAAGAAIAPLRERAQRDARLLGEEIGASLGG